MTIATPLLSASSQLLSTGMHVAQTKQRAAYLNEKNQAAIDQLKNDVRQEKQQQAQALHDLKIQQRLQHGTRLLRMAGRGLELSHSATDLLQQKNAFDRNDLTTAKQQADTAQQSNQQRLQALLRQGRYDRRNARLNMGMQLLKGI